MDKIVTAYQYIGVDSRNRGDIWTKDLDGVYRCSNHPTRVLSSAEMLQDLDNGFVREYIAFIRDPEIHKMD